MRQGLFHITPPFIHSSSPCWFATVARLNVTAAWGYSTILTYYSMYWKYLMELLIVGGMERTHSYLTENLRKKKITKIIVGAYLHSTICHHKMLLKGPHTKKKSFHCHPAVWSHFGCICPGFELHASTQIKHLNGTVLRLKIVFQKLIISSQNQCPR